MQQEIVNIAFEDNLIKYVLIEDQIDDFQCLTGTEIRNRS